MVKVSGPRNRAERSAVQMSAFMSSTRLLLHLTVIKQSACDKPFLHKDGQHASEAKTFRWPPAGWLQ